MSGMIFRRGLVVLALVAGLASGAKAQLGAQGFATPDDASYALANAIRHDDEAALASMIGPKWRSLLPRRADDVSHLRDTFLANWDAQRSSMITPDGNKAVLQIGVNGWTVPLPLAKEGGTWHFDFDAAKKEILARRIGHNELTVVQALLGIGDAQREYATREALRTGTPQYARRLMSSPGKKDGLYWETRGGEAPSPLGPLIAQAQPGDGPENGYYGYHFRLLNSQGPDARGGAHPYLVNGRMIGGYAVIAWPVRYGETGVMTFIVNYNSDVDEQDLGPDTPARAAAITIFNPDKGWDKADTAPP